MGKGRSPGKWFKNLLLGKKSSSKSNSSKKNDSFKLSSNKDVLGSSEDSLVISAPITGANATNGVLSEKNKLSHDRDIPSTGNEEARALTIAQEDHENLKLTEAAMTVQAACRGYQARQSFRMLKGGTIQLQALIRGHLVRRQAVSALYCVKGIVKIQALARGYIVRRSDIGLAVQKIRKDTQCSNSIQVVTSTHAEKLSESVFVQKLLVSSGFAVPLSLNRDPTEPNFAWKWLDRWTVSHFWAPLPELKKKSVSDEKTGSGQTVKRKQVKRTTQKSPPVKADDGSISGSNKYKQRPKKDSNSSLLSAQEHPQKEIEKNNSVKKSRLQSVSDRSEAVTEKRKYSIRKSSDHAVTNVSDHGPSVCSEKMKDLAVSKSDPEKSLGHQDIQEHDNELKSLQKPSVQNGAVRTEGVGEKRKHSTRKISDNAVTDVSGQGTSASSEKKKDLAVLNSKESDPDKGVGHQEDKHDNEPKSPKTCLQNVADRSEVVNEKEKHSATEISDHTVTDVSVQCTNASSEKKKDLAVSNGKESDAEKSLRQQEGKHDNESKSPKRTSLDKYENVADRSEVVNEKRKHSTLKSSDHTVTDVSDQGRHTSSEKKKDLAVSKAKESVPEKSLGQQEENHDNEPNSPKKTVLQNFADKSEVANGKRKHSAGKISDHTVTSEPGPNSSSEKRKVLTASKSKESDPKKSVGQQAENKHADELLNDPIPIVQTSLTNGGNEGIHGVGEDLNGGDSSVSNNYQRRASLPANFNDQDNESHSTPRLPSYMAPTESVKAKLRAQGSPRFATDFADKNSVTRRHSLSSSFNGKSGSFSPRAERLVAMSSRGVLRNDRSLSSSRDATDKLIQPQWRR